MAAIKKQKPSVVKYMENWNTCVLLVGMQNGAAITENSMECPQNIKNRLTLRSSNFTSKHLLKELKPVSQIDINTLTFIVALHKMAKLWKQPKCPSWDEWRKFYTLMEYYLTLKNEKILQYATIWMNLKNIMVNKPVTERRRLHDIT